MMERTRFQFCGSCSRTHISLVTVKLGSAGLQVSLNQLFGADFFGKLAALRFGAHVAPDQRGAHDVAVLIEHDRAVHLPGETNAGDVFSAQAGLRHRFAHGDAACAPPVFGMLLGPADLRGSKRRVLFGSGRDDAALLVDDQRACSAGANVNTEYVNGRLLSAGWKWNRRRFVSIADAEQWQGENDSGAFLQFAKYGALSQPFRIRIAPNRQQLQKVTAMEDPRC